MREEAGPALSSSLMHLMIVCCVGLSKFSGTLCSKSIPLHLNAFPVIEQAFFTGSPLFVLCYFLFLFCCFLVFDSLSSCFTVSQALLVYKQIYVYMIFLNL